MDTMTPKEFAAAIGVCVKTLDRWDNKGILPVRRTVTGRKYYLRSDVENYYMATEQPHDARWICVGLSEVKCSTCGAVYNYDDNYCGSCGARMVWTKEERERLNTRKELLHEDNQ